MGQREILFRGKRIGNGEWVYGFVMNKDKTRLGYYDDGNHFDIKEVIPETVSQYIGYTDEKGNKIFEGDILDDRNGLPEYVVVFSSGCFRLSSIKEYKEEDYLYVLPVDEYVLSIMNVVGNVYDGLIKSNK